MKVLDLFSGVGGFSLGLERAGMETVAFCEFDKKAQLVLKKHWPDVPIYDDVRELNGEKIREEIGAVQLISGGFPCQPFSQAGERKGEEDDRHLWPEYFRLIQEIRPRWVIGENVAGLISMGLDQVLSDLESADYSCQTLVIPACAVNAPHRRDRVWIIARRNAMGNSEYNGSSTAKESRSPSSISNNSSQGENKTFQSKGTSGPGNIDNVADSECNTEGAAYRSNRRASSAGRQKQSVGKRNQVGSDLGNGSDNPRGNTDFWAVEPDVGRVAHGIPNRVDRLKQLGNAVVPQVVEQIGRAIMQIERRNHGTS